MQMNVAVTRTAKPGADVAVTAIIGLADRREGAREVDEKLVPPVGVEPTLWTLLGGRPLPLGYGGDHIIPPT
jgi:hypothetical protein